MANKPYLTSNDLIETIKLNSSFPLSQVTYSDEDLLKFANHELFLAQVPSVLQYHQDYFSYRETVPLRRNRNRYDIPYRAIGQKIYDVYYVEPRVLPDNNPPLPQIVDDLHDTHFRKLSFIDAADKAFFQFNNNGSNTPSHYYIEANQIVLTSHVGDTVSGNLVFVYYLRPNNLVLDNRAAICEGFTKEITITNATIVAGNTLSITRDEYPENDVTLIAGTDFVIGATDVATATNLNIAINNTEIITSTITGAILTIKYDHLDTKIISNNIVGITIDTAQGIEFDQVPANIMNNTLVDFLKKKGGHRTYTFDIRLGKNVVSSNIIKFKPIDIPADFEIEDYICSQFECIIPQIPSDLHSLLAERTVARVLEAQGDLAGLQTANAKIGDMEARQATMMSNRVEGSPRKIFNRNSLLRYGKGINGNRTKA